MPHQIPRSRIATPRFLVAERPEHPPHPDSGRPMHCPSGVPKVRVGWPVGTDAENYPPANGVDHSRPHRPRHGPVEQRRGGLMQTTPAAERSSRSATEYANQGSQNRRHEELWEGTGDQSIRIRSDARPPICVSSRPLTDNRPSRNSSNVSRLEVIRHSRRFSGSFCVARSRAANSDGPSEDC